VLAPVSKMNKNIISIHLKLPQYGSNICKTSTIESVIKLTKNVLAPRCQY